MQQLTLGMLLAVFEEMFGPALFWGLVAAAALALAAFLVVVIRDGGIRGRRLARAELLAPLGGIAAVLFVQTITSSGFGDIGGPVDLIVLLGIFLAGAAGAAMLGYVLLGLLRREKA